jgi:hypothetical protein
MAAILGESLKITGLVASGDLSAIQWQPVKAASTVGAVIACSAVTDAVLGILVNDPTSGQPAEIVGLGMTKCKLGASITYGSKLTPNSTGYLKASSSANDQVVGIALATSVSAGEIHPILVVRSNF